MLLFVVVVDVVVIVVGGGVVVVISVTNYSYVNNSLTNLFVFFFSLVQFFTLSVLLVLLVLPTPGLN